MASARVNLELITKAKWTSPRCFRPLSFRLNTFQDLKMKRTIPKFTLMRLSRLWNFWKSRTSSLKALLMTTSSPFFLRLIKARALPEIIKPVTKALNKNKGLYSPNSSVILLIKSPIFPTKRDSIPLPLVSLMILWSRWRESHLMKLDKFKTIHLRSHLHSTGQLLWMTSYLICVKLVPIERRIRKVPRRSLSLALKTMNQRTSKFLISKSTLRVLKHSQALSVTGRLVELT